MFEGRKENRGCWLVLNHKRSAETRGIREYNEKENTMIGDRRKQQGNH
jgi:hypothetical protein